MIKFRYNYEKNSKLLFERGIGFEEIIQSIADGNLLDITKHHNQEQYPDQQILYVRILTEIYAIPYIKEDDNTIFLKTLFPSRKARKKFLG
ncbi:MAG: hypothetical protein DMENIID0002_10980 [Rickettsia endosymbiont of Sergentomyia squamirostris]|uniref:Toxin n=1 Tax=Candidatus Tisiphia endosymbiont of Sergentomyia squamirostris TaxID=3113639 RepID=A0AAT9G9F4_9RICK